MPKAYTSLCGDIHHLLCRRPSVGKIRNTHIHTERSLLVGEYQCVVVVWHTTTCVPTRTQPRRFRRKNVTLGGLAGLTSELLVPHSPPLSEWFRVVASLRLPENRSSSSGPPRKGGWERHHHGCEYTPARLSHSRRLLEDSFLPFQRWATGSHSTPPQSFLEAKNGCDFAPQNGNDNKRSSGSLGAAASTGTPRRSGSRRCRGFPSSR